MTEFRKLVQKYDNIVMGNYLLSCVYSVQIRDDNAMTRSDAQ